MEACLICMANSGEKRISPGIPIYEGQYWQVEHAFPTSLLGWLVIVLKRHIEELHNLRKEEWLELASIEYELLKCMKTKMDTSREYIACFAEMEGFKHIHFHVIPKSSAFDDENKGTKAFQYLKPDEESRISSTVINAYCDEMNHLMNESFRINE